LGGWEVRLNGRRGGHHFRTLREAKDWARQWVISRGPHEMSTEVSALVRMTDSQWPAGHYAHAMLSAALAGDQVAHGAFFDLTEEETEHRWKLCEVVSRQYLQGIGIFPTVRPATH
jgi:hypothetical protein